MTRPSLPGIDPSFVPTGLRLKAAVALASLALLAAACGGGDEKPAAVQQTDATSEVAAGSSTSSSTPQLLAAVPAPLPPQPAIAEASQPVTEPPRPALSSVNDIQTLRYTLSIDATGSLLGDIPADIRQAMRNVRGSFVSPNRSQYSTTYQGLPFTLTVIGDQMWISVLGLVHGPEYVAFELPTIQTIWDDGLARSFNSFACGTDYETVNGLAARHCAMGLDQFSQLQTDFGIILPADVVSTLSDLAIDVWVSDEGYPMRLRLSASGVDAGRRDFRVNLSFNITEINGAVSIRTPS